MWDTWDACAQSYHLVALKGQPKIAVYGLCGAGAEGWYRICAAAFEDVFRGLFTPAGVSHNRIDLQRFT
jgi:hypothetical protein